MQTRVGTAAGSSDPSLARLADESAGSTASASRVASCPSAYISGDIAHPAVYALHPLLMPEEGVRDTSRAGSPLLRQRKLVQARRSTETILAFESSQVGSNAYQARPSAVNVDQGRILPPLGYYDPATTDNHERVAPPLNIDPEDATSPAAGDLRFRHLGNRSGNFLFADGHVEALRPTEVLRKNVRIEP